MPTHKEPQTHHGYIANAPAQDPENERLENTTHNDALVAATSVVPVLENQAMNHSTQPKRASNSPGVNRFFSKTPHWKHFEHVHKVNFGNPRDDKYNLHKHHVKNDLSTFSALD